VTDGVIDEYTSGGWDSMSPAFDIMGANGTVVTPSSPRRITAMVCRERQLSFEEWAAIPLVTLTAWHHVGDAGTVEGRGVGARARRRFRHRRDGDSSRETLRRDAGHHEPSAATRKSRKRRRSAWTRSSITGRTILPTK